MITHQGAANIMEGSERVDAGTSQMGLEGAANIREGSERDDAGTLEMGLEDAANTREGSERDDAGTSQMGLESAATLMEEGVQDERITPHIGMEFPTHDHAYDFYNRYALKTGFGISRSSNSYSRKDRSKVISREYVCCKAGQRKLKIKDGAAQDVHNRELRVGCTAKMRIVLTNSNTWKVSKFDEKHVNHELTTPTKTSKHRSHKKLHRNPAVRKLITQLHSQGIRNSAIARMVNVVEVGQHDIVTPQSDIVTPQQVHDHLRVARTNNIGQNCATIIKHFQEKKANDSDFYFSFEVSEDMTLRSVFWADGRSRESNLKFSDVIIFMVLRAFS